MFIFTIRDALAAGMIAVAILILAVIVITSILKDFMERFK